MKIFTDGSSHGNPGPAGSAAVIVPPNEKPVIEVSRSLGVATNNVAEYDAVVLALSLVIENKLFDDPIVIHSDSQLVIKQLTGEFKVKNAELLKIFDVVKRLKLMIPRPIAWKHVRGHCGNKYNERADYLANLAAKNNR